VRGAHATVEDGRTAVPTRARSNTALVVVVAAAAMVGTLPGRTQGLGLITEPLLAELDLGRVPYATINLWATLVGSVFAPGIGRFIDRYGSRVVVTVLAVALGLTVVVMSQVAAVAALAVAITVTRGFGQSALSVASLTLIGRSGAGRLDSAMAAFSIVMSMGFMIAFPIVGSLVQSQGWRVAWLAIGLALIAGLAPFVWFARQGDDAPEVAGDAAQAIGLEWGAALRTPAFWVFGLGAAMYGLVASGIGLFNESILAERGFDASVYYQTLVVTALTALAGNFLGGWLARVWTLTRLLAASMFVLALGLGALPVLTTLWHVMAWAVVMGIGGGCVMVLFFTVWPEVYGRRHLGSIQGSAQALTVVASAVGPLLVAWGVERTGSYALVFLVLAGVIGALGMGALAVTLPRRAPVRRRAGL
jgi:MFS family permease